MSAFTFNPDRQVVNTDDPADPKIYIQSEAFKLKDQGGRNMQVVNLKQLFGYCPEEILLIKVAGENNKIVIMAERELTPEARKKREEYKP